FNIHDPNTTSAFLSNGRFDLFARLTFPEPTKTGSKLVCNFNDAGLARNQQTDDATDDGDLSQDPLRIQQGHDYSYKILYDWNAKKPEDLHAAMLWDLLGRIRATGNAELYTKQVFRFEILY
ncbi:hypothetical protein MPER_00132, partial [Moniliophthora perniciosa FA553]